ncbi:MAG: hypothetical protein NW218_14645 [Saprospiraceae bacterium]|nr:hypothetical protein [Saprospiraceae bacterium]
MKNKHLVLLFMLVLVAGLLRRYVPLPYAHFFQTNLIRIDRGSLDWVSISAPGSNILEFKKTEQGWVGTQNERTLLVADSLIFPLVQPLFAMESIRAIPEEASDSSGLQAGVSLVIQLRTTEQKVVQIGIGRVITYQGAPATFVQIDQHVGRFLVKGDLRSPFQTNLNAFRTPGIWKWRIDQIQACQLNWPDLPALTLERNDSTGLWANTHGVTVTQDFFVQWLKCLDGLNTAPYADHFDPVAHPDAQVANFDFYQSKDTVRLYFYQLQRPDLPEVLRNYPAQAAFSATYFVHSSQNKGNFFAITDTAKARQILAGPGRLEAILRDSLAHDTH